jgi:hypothetical protein
MNRQTEGHQTEKKYLTMGTKNGLLLRSLSRISSVGLKNDKIAAFFYFCAKKQLKIRYETVDILDPLACC